MLPNALPAQEQVPVSGTTKVVQERVPVSGTVKSTQAPVSSTAESAQPPGVPTVLDAVQVPKFPATHEIAQGAEVSKALANPQAPENTQAQVVPNTPLLIPKAPMQSKTTNTFENLPLPRPQQ